MIRPDPMNDDDELAAIMRRAPIRPADDDNRSGFMLGKLLAGLLIIVAILVVLTIATKAMGNVADTRLDAEEWKGW